MWFQVGTVVGSLKDVRPENWALTEAYQAYMMTKESDNVNWVPELSYYINLVRRMQDSILFNRENHYKT